MLISEGDVDFALDTWKVSFLRLIKATSLRRYTDIIVELRRDTKTGTGIYRIFAILQDSLKLLSQSLTKHSPTQWDSL